MLYLVYSKNYVKVGHTNRSFKEREYDYGTPKDVIEWVDCRPGGTKLETKYRNALKSVGAADRNHPEWILVDDVTLANVIDKGFKFFKKGV